MIVLKRKNKERLEIKLIRFIKPLLQQFSRDRNKKIVYVVGCQRSGTTMLMRVLEKDVRVNSYEESSCLFYEDSLRLREMEYVLGVVRGKKAPLSSIKPLLDSQNIRRILDYYENSFGLWIYRHYKDVANSSVTHFGKANSIRDISAIVYRCSGNWRAENTSKQTLDIVTDLFSLSMDAYDAAALFWYCRNILFFEQRLDKDDRVILCNYEDIVNMPAEKIASIYHFLDFKFTGKRIVSGVHGGAVNNGSLLKLSPNIESLCNDLWKRLNKCYRGQN